LFFFVTNFIFINKVNAEEFFSGDVIINATSGGNCNLVGSWTQETKICLLNKDILGRVFISGGGIILDGANHLLEKSPSSVGTTNGINISGQFSTVKNMNIKGFSSGIVVSSSNSNIVDNNFLNIGSYSTFLSGSNHIVKNNDFTNSFVGIFINQGIGNVIEDNNFSNNSSSAIRLNFSQSTTLFNLIKGNTMQDGGYGIYNDSSRNLIISNNTIKNNSNYGYRGIGSSALNVKIFNNNFINNNLILGDQVNISPTTLLYDLLPIGGNYWSNFDSIAEGCMDSNLDNICDLPKVVQFSFSADNFPWKSENGWLETAEPETFYSEIKNLPGGFVTVRSLPSLSGESIKTLPNSWVVQIIAKTDQLGQPVISGGYRWYQINDPTDLSVGWMPARTDSQTPTTFLSYEAEKQTEFVEKSVTPVSNTSARKQTILDAINHYYNDSSFNSNLYSSNDSSLNLSLFNSISFPKELILAIISQEAPASMDNQHVSFDYGHGVMQVTFHAWANEPNNYEDNKWDNRGKRSKIKLTNCKNILPNNSGQEKIGLNEYKKCYSNTLTKNTLIKPYKHYEDNLSAPLYKQYANTKQSFFANIKDGLGVLREKYSAKCPKPNITVSGEIFTCNDIEKILMVWGYNGFAKNKTTGEYTGNYLQLVSDRLVNLTSYFSVNPYVNNDHLIQKLSIANVNKKTVRVFSPVELRVIDENGNITGLVNQEKLEEIQNSIYDVEQEGVAILFPESNVFYKVVGTEEGNYGILIDSTINGIQTLFNGTDLPIKEDEIHTYSVNEELLALGGNGVNVSIDENGDGLSERNISVGPILNDISPPEISIESIEPTYILDSSVVFNASVVDNIDELPTILVSLNGLPISFNMPIILNTIGTHVLLIEAVDATGNLASESISFDVQYKFGGFQAPLNTEKKFNVNQTVPIKFWLNNINNQIVHNASGFISIKSLSGSEIWNQPFFEDGNSGMYVSNLQGLNVGQGNWILNILPSDGSIFTKNLTFISN